MNSSGTMRAIATAAASALLSLTLAGPASARDRSQEQWEALVHLRNRTPLVVVQADGTHRKGEFKQVTWTRLILASPLGGDVTFRREEIRKILRPLGPPPDKAEAIEEGVGIALIGLVLGSGIAAGIERNSRKPDETAMWTSFVAGTAGGAALGIWHAKKKMSKNQKVIYEARR